MRNSSNRREQTMGRRPIHDEAMSAAERQRRRRAKLRNEPWRDQRRAIRAILQSLRDLQGTADGEGKLDSDQVALIVDRAVANLAIEDEAAVVEARATVAKLLDPNEPLPERGHRGRRSRRGHRMGDGMRRRHGRRRGDGDDGVDKDKE